MYFIPTLKHKLGGIKIHYILYDPNVNKFNNHFTREEFNITLPAL